jgi:hypothetical protein
VNCTRNSELKKPGLLPGFYVSGFSADLVHQLVEPRIVAERVHALVLQEMRLILIAELDRPGEPF